MVLLYFSNRMPGYYPTITIPLTRSSVPPSLRKIHLVVDVKGQTHTQTFPAQRNLKYEFAWDRQDGYRRRVSGKTTATSKLTCCYTQLPMSESSVTGRSQNWIRVRSGVLSCALGLSSKF